MHEVAVAQLVDNYPLTYLCVHFNAFSFYGVFLQRAASPSYMQEQKAIKDGYAFTMQI